MATECIHCSKKFKLVPEYAQHILDRHFDDEIRVEWANEILHPSPPKGYCVVCGERIGGGSLLNKCRRCAK